MTRSLSLLLPGFQHFDCRSCAHCCHNLLVLVSRSERRRILDAGWAERLPGVRLFHRYRYFGRRPLMLAHRPDGGCVFLGEDNLCRLHAESGPQIKPLACRLFPFVPVPSVDGVRMDLRCDCPSVAANKGRPLQVHAQEIARMVAELGYRQMASAPPWRGMLRLSSREYAAVIEAFLRLVRKGPLGMRTRLQAGCRLVETLYEVSVGKVRGERFAELMALLSESAAAEFGEGLPPLPPLRRRVEKMFGQWLFLHALADDPQLARAGLFTKIGRSWVRYGQSRAFAKGRGSVPEVCANWPTTTFEQLAAVQPAPDEALEPVCRFIQIKLDAHAFAGPAYFRHDVIHGLTALWLFPAIAGWFARLQAVRAGHEAMDADDVLSGVRTAAMTFGASPLFGRLSEKLRLRGLAEPGVPTALLARFGP